VIKVLVVDDHAIVREGLKRILDEDPGIELVGEGEDGHAAVRMTRAQRPDVVLLDVSMPGRSGLDALRDIRQAHAKARVLILSMHPEDQYAIRCLREGADGYLTKESAPELLLEAIHKLSLGGKYVSPTLAEQMAMHLAPDHDKPLHAQLSPRELQVLEQIGQGLTVSEIGVAMCLSVKTISTYRARILEKLQLHNNAQLMRYVIEHQLGDF